VELGKLTSAGVGGGTKWQTRFKVHFRWPAGDDEEQVLYFQALEYLFHGLGLPFGSSSLKIA
jgi:hypothetical protein